MNCIENKGDYKIMINERLNNLKKRVKALSYQNRPLIIWGMGDYASFASRSLKGIEGLKVEAFTDNVSERGREHNGIPTIGAAELISYDNPLVLVCVKRQDAVENIILFLEELKIDYMLFDEFVIGKNCDKVMNCISLCSDEKSKHVYTELLARRLDNYWNNNCRDLFEDNQYYAIPHFCEEDFDETYVDLGAFVGDTLEEFLFKKCASFKTYYAFEPDKDNYAAMKHRISRLEKEWNISEGRIIPVNNGVGQKAGQEYFLSNGIVSGISVDGKGTNINIVSLDDFFKEKSVSTIKADIEGYEGAMLLGAETILRRDRPKLAICIYHSVPDFYNIMDWVNSLNLGYKFWVRHHSTKFSDTIMYAVSE